jgi:imidazoleglycerol phosphate synthase glutamine amidotransferase subunit HisH
MNYFQVKSNGYKTEENLIYWKYNKKLIYGTQFHPESSKAGRIILKNFIDMARHH